MVIASLVIGVISIAASWYAAGAWGKAYHGSMPQPVSAPAPKPPLEKPGFPPFAGEIVKDGGLAADTRASIIKTLPPNALPADRVPLFNLLLAETGAIMFPDSKPRTIDVEQGFGADLALKTTGGHVVVRATSAWFRQIDGDGFVVVAGDITASGNDSTTPRFWNIVAINDRIAKLRSDYPAVTDMQAGFVADRLRNQFMKNLKEADDKVKLSIHDVSLQTGNVLSLAAGTASYFVLPDGRGIDKASEPQGIDPVSGRPLSLQQPSVDDHQPMFPGDYRWMHALEIFCQATIALAAFLIIAGISLLASPRLGLKLQVIYAVLKLVFIAGEIVLSINYFMTIEPGEKSQTPFDTGAGTRGLIQTVLMQIIYPLAILAILRSPKVREFLKRDDHVPA